MLALRDQVQRRGISKQLGTQLGEDLVSQLHRMVKDSEEAAKLARTLQQQVGGDRTLHAHLVSNPWGAAACAHSHLVYRDQHLW